MGEVGGVGEDAIDEAETDVGEAGGVEEDDCDEAK